MSQKDSFIAKTAHWVFMSCEQATLSLEKQQAQELSGIAQWRLRGHLRICKWCRAYVEKAKMLDILLQHRVQTTEQQLLHDDEVEEFKARVKEKLKK